MIINWLNNNIFGISFVISFNDIDTFEDLKGLIRFLDPILASARELDIINSSITLENINGSIRVFEPIDGNSKYLDNIVRTDNENF